jgi:hypothetical protein
MKTTFINTSKDKRTELRKEGRSHLESRAEDFKFFQSINGQDYDELAPANGSVTPEMERIQEIGDFYNYGLAVDYVTPGTFNNKAGYLRYQLSYGGPSEEIRFYFTPKAREAYKIEFVYLNWGVGVGFDVTNEDWAKWLFDWFNEVGTAEAEMNKAFENE